MRDTLGDGTYQSLPTGLWGSSPKDVYVVGHSSNFGDKKIWHYNGQQWEDITFRYFEAFSGKSIYSFTPNRVFGFGGSDVWIVGDRDTSAISNEIKKGFILRYDGQTWKGTWLPSSVWHTAIWGLSANNLWVGGGFGQLFHFDGSGWLQYALPDSVWINHIEGINETKVYASGISFPNSVERITYYEWNGTMWSQIESRLSTDPLPGIQIFFSIADGTIITGRGQYVSKRISQGNLQVMYNNPQAQFGVLSAFGATNIFATGSDNTGNELVYHFNGQNWARIAPINQPGGNVIRVWTDGKEAFLIARELNNPPNILPRSYILRGK